jgi:hypothetical protein
MCDYKGPIEYENDKEAPFQDLYTKSDPTKQLKIYLNSLYRTSNQRLFVFPVLTYFEIWFYSNENETFQYHWDNF